jgi:hypothetical protein
MILSVMHHCQNPYILTDISFVLPYFTNYEYLKKYILFVKLKIAMFIVSAALSRDKPKKQY